MQPSCHSSLGPVTTTNLQGCHGNCVSYPQPHCSSPRQHFLPSLSANPGAEVTRALLRLPPSSIKTFGSLAMLAPPRKALLLPDECSAGEKSPGPQSRSNYTGRAVKKHTQGELHVPRSCAQCRVRPCSPGFTTKNKVLFFTGSCE